MILINNLNLSSIDYDYDSKSGKLYIYEVNFLNEKNYFVDMCSSEKINNLVSNETEYKNQQVLHTLIIKIHVVLTKNRILERSSEYSDRSLMTQEKAFWTSLMLIRLRLLKG